MQSRRALLIAAAALGAAWPAGAAPPAAEQARIDRLIGVVASRSDLQFVRNGSAYKAADAARFLREKLKSQGRDVQTAEDFIERIASRSSTSGKAYLIRHADGREQPAGAFLREELQRLER
jgi:hypothetical protein